MKLPGLDNVIKMEMDVIKVCSDMSTQGVCIDLDRVRQGIIDCENTVRDAEKIMRDYAGDRDFNPGSTAQLQALCDKKGLSYKTEPRTGNGKFDKFHMREYLDMWPVALTEPLKAYRAASKYWGYYDNFNKYSRNGKVHPSYFTIGACTGRFSVKEPALQTIPKQGPEAKPDAYDEDTRKDKEKDISSVRKCMVPSEGYDFVAIDYSQQELRLFFDYVNYKPMIDALNDGADIHQVIADKAKVPRDTAKCLNFGILYGAGVSGISRLIECSYKEAQEFLEAYYASIPPLRSFKNGVTHVMKTRGYIKNWNGRVVRTKPGEEYKALNYLIQSSGADMIKKAMVAVWRRLNLDIVGRLRMVLQVHDELLFERNMAHYSEDILKDVVDIMESVYVPFNDVKMKASVSVGTSFDKKFC